MSDRCRAFFALPLPPPVLASVERFSADLRRVCERRGITGRWCKPEQLHVTLKFLGYVERSAAAGLAGTLARRAAKLAPITSGLAQLTAFPSTRRARVLVVRLSDPSGAATKLAAQLEDDAATLGVPREERAFVPHLTLARFKPPVDVTELLEPVTVPQDPVELGVLRLYESRLRPEGSYYAVLAEARLGH